MGYSSDEVGMDARFRGHDGVGSGNYGFGSDNEVGSDNGVIGSDEIWGKIKSGRVRHGWLYTATGAFMGG